MAVFTTTVKYKALSGEIDTVRAQSQVSAAAADALAAAIMKLKSGQLVLSASRSTGIDVAGFALGHADASEEATLSYKFVNGLGERSETLDDVSLAYKSSLNDGSIDVTNADIVAFFAAKGIAVGQNVVPTKGHY